MWLAKQKVAAAFFGVSIQAFQKWDVECIREEGRSKLYDVRAIQDDKNRQSADSAEELNLTEERARLAKESADKLEMENKVRRGDLAEVADIQSAVVSVIHATKARILAIPAQLSRYLENQTSQNIETQLHDALHDALEDLSELSESRPQAAKKANGQSVGRSGAKTKSRGKRAAGQVAH